MNKAHSRTNWQNYPSVDTPLNETNLNKLDSALDTIDDRVIELDTTKADQSTVLGCLKNVTYNTNTGVFTFTWQNGTQLQVDLNIEKIPVSFTMSDAGVITMRNTDGTTSTVNVGNLIKTYTFTTANEIVFNTTTDSSGNKTIKASIKDGSIVAAKLQPNFLADCNTAKNGAVSAASSASESSLDAEAWANGTRGGSPVASNDPAYQNNAKWWKDKAAVTSLSSMLDVNLNSPSSQNIIVYDATSSKWVNKGIEFISTSRFGTCSTARNVVTKVVTCANFRLTTGAVIAVKFTNTDTAAPSSGNITLNVNGTGAKPVVFAANAATVTYSTSGEFYNNANRLFLYDGTNWIYIRDTNTTYTPPSIGFGYGTCGTAAATTAKVVTLSNYGLVAGGTPTVKFTYDVPANATLNINNRGAKPIKFLGANITAGVIKAGDTCTFCYDGTNYHLITCDRLLNLMKKITADFAITQVSFVSGSQLPSTGVEGGIYIATE